MSYKSLSVLIPLYNKENLINTALNKTLELLHGIDYEIIVIENESTDNSKAEVESFIKNSDKNITLISSEKGLGNALKTGIMNSSKDYVTCIPADFTTGTSEIAFFKNQSNFDYVLSSRLSDSSNAYQSLDRKLISKIFNFLKKLILNINYLDTQFSFIIKKDIARYLCKKCISSGFFITTELVYFAIKNGVKISEIPVEIHEQEGNVTTVKVLSDSLKILFEMLMLFKREGRLK